MRLLALCLLLTACGPVRHLVLPSHPDPSPGYCVLRSYQMQFVPDSLRSAFVHATHKVCP